MALGTRDAGRLPLRLVVLLLAVGVLWLAATGFGGLLMVLSQEPACGAPALSPGQIDRDRLVFLAASALSVIPWLVLSIALRRWWLVAVGMVAAAPLELVALLDDQTYWAPFCF